MHRSLFRRVAALTLLLPLVAGFAACSDDPADPGHDEELPVEMRLTVGGQTLTVFDNGTYTPSPFIMAPGTYQVAVQFIDDEDQVMTLDAGEYRLEIQSNSTGVVSYQSASAFSGTLTATAGSTAINPQLFHIGEGHPDFGPFPIQVTVQ